MSGVIASFAQRVLRENGALKWANLVTLSRALLILPIVGLLLLGRNHLALALGIVAACTDLLDGWIARRSARASEFGAQLDAAVDNLFSLSILIFLWLAWPGLLTRHALALSVLFGAPVLYLLLSWLICRRFLMFHFWSAKLGAVLLFSLWPVLALSGAEWPIAVTATIVAGSRVEQLLYLLRGGRRLDVPHGGCVVEHPGAAEGTCG